VRNQTFLFVKEYKYLGVILEEFLSFQQAPDFENEAIKAFLASLLPAFETG